MAFAIRALSVLAYANGFTLWHYKTGKESLADVAKENFFSEAADMMAAGDMILTSGGGGGRVLCVAEAGDNRVLTAPLA